MNSMTVFGSIAPGKEAANPDSSFVRNLANIFLYIRAIQRHSGGEMIELEMMGHVLIHFNWKQYLFHRGCSFDLKSIFGAGLIAGG